MYLLREGSHNSDEPYMVTIPQPETNYLEKQTLFFPEIGVAKWFFESGIAERGLINWIMENFIKEDTIMIDIGAHVGTYSWIPAKVAKHVYSFECNPKIFCYLAANIALHRLEDKITPYQFALGNKEGTIDYLLRSVDGGGNGVREGPDVNEVDAMAFIPPVMHGVLGDLMDMGGGDLGGSGLDTAMDIAPEIPSAPGTSLETGLPPGEAAPADGGGPRKKSKKVTLT